MTVVDLVSVLRYNGSSVDILQDFSADRNKLLSILETMTVGEGQDFAEAPTTPAAPTQVRLWPRRQRV